MKKVNIIDIDTYVKQVHNNGGFSLYGDFDFSSVFGDFDEPPLSSGLNLGEYPGTIIGGSATGGKTSFNLDFLRDILIENDVNVTIGNTDPINKDERKPFKLKRK